MVAMQHPNRQAEPHGYAVPISTPKPRSLPVVMTDNRTSWIFDGDGRPVVQVLDDVACLPVRPKLL